MPSHFSRTTRSTTRNLNSQGQLATTTTPCLCRMHIFTRPRTSRFCFLPLSTQVDVEQSDSQFIPCSVHRALVPSSPARPLGHTGNRVAPAVLLFDKSGPDQRHQMHPKYRSPLRPCPKSTSAEAVDALNPKDMFGSITNCWSFRGFGSVRPDCPSPISGQSLFTKQNCINYQDAATCTNLEPKYYMATFHD